MGWSATRSTQDRASWCAEDGTASAATSISSTGNYNPTTARLYTDLGLLTCQPDFGEDATNLFNLLTGIGQFQATQKLLVAPFRTARPHARISSSARAATPATGMPARIIAKMNALRGRRQSSRRFTTPRRAGVKIDLLVRGICCLRPGVNGVSENITVRSIVDRFLEHSRIFYFENGGQPELFLGSADWMPRNFFRRIEVVFPVEDGVLRERLIGEILATTLADNTKARVLHADGSYRLPRLAQSETRRRSQSEFIALATPDQTSRRAPAHGRAKHPVMTLAPSPFAARPK